MIDIKKDIQKYLIYLPIIISAIGITFSISILHYEKNKLEEIGIKSIKESQLKVEKEKLKLLVNYTIKTIDELKNKIPQKELYKKLQEIYTIKKNYIFIYKLNYPINQTIYHNNFAKMIVNINTPNLINKTITLNYKDNHNIPFRKIMLQNIINKKETYITYYYKNPFTGKITEKLSYFKYYEPLNLIIGSGTYIENLNKIINNYKQLTEQEIIEVIKLFALISILIIFIIALIYIQIKSLIIKEIEKYNKTIKRQANKIKCQLYFDKLTKLQSRYTLIQKLKNNRFKYLILIDIDNFKNINQLYNAKIGDEYLKQFAKLLLQFKKTQTTPLNIFRIGSDEFIIGINKDNEKLVKEITNNLNLFLSHSYIEIDNEKFDIDITIAYAKTPNVLEKTLITISIAKEQHLSICSYEEIKDKSKEKEFFEIKKLLKTAIEKNQITPYAQAIVDRNKNIIKYELLMRIVTEDKVIPPYFLDYAKKAKLYNQISHQMIKKSFEFIEKCDKLCSINLDLEDIKNPETIELLEKYVNKINKPVIFEILESDSITDYKYFIKFIEKFRKKGVLFAIDDFGSGFSNYQEILSFQPEYLKIDGSLIKNILKDNTSYILTYSISSLSAMLEIKNTAEFVENEEIFEKLKNIGIEEFQGFYIDKPKPITEIIK